MKVQGCHNCPFHVTDTGATFLCRHPQLRSAEYPVSHRDAKEFRQAGREFNRLLEAAELRVSFPLDLPVYDVPTPERPGYPDTCPLLGVPLTIELDPSHR